MTPSTLDTLNYYLLTITFPPPPHPPYLTSPPPPHPPYLPTPTTPTLPYLPTTTTPTLPPYPHHTHLITTITLPSHPHHTRLITTITLPPHPHLTHLITTITLPHHHTHLIITITLPLHPHHTHLITTITLPPHPHHTHLTTHLQRADYQKISEAMQRKKPRSLPLPPPSPGWTSPDLESSLLTSTLIRPLGGRTSGRPQPPLPKPPQDPLVDDVPFSMLNYRQLNLPSSLPHFEQETWLCASISYV